MHKSIFMKKCIINRSQAVVLSHDRCHIRNSLQKFLLQNCKCIDTPEHDRAVTWPQFPGDARRDSVEDRGFHTTGNR